MPQLIVIADDLTGAADSGIAFAKSGLNTLVQLAPGPIPPCDVLVISTHSRHLSPKAAAARVKDTLVSGQISTTNTWLYKKIDSTLRGHPGSELATVMAVLGFPRALIAPAFPAQGRTTVHGQQYVNGTPLAETTFGAEVHHSEVAAFFRNYFPETALHHISQNTSSTAISKLLTEKSGLFIADAETDADLTTLAKAAVDGNIRLLCGSAGLAQALDKTLALVSTTPADSLPIRGSGPILIVAGSQHAQTDQQLRVAGKAGVRLFQPGFIAQPNRNNLYLKELMSVVNSLNRGDHVALCIGALQHLALKLDSQTIVERLGEMVKILLAQTNIGGLVLTGGDTAMGVCGVLEASTLHLQTDIEPGIPAAQLADGPFVGLRLVTKAGGFGTDEALMRAIAYLS